MNTSGLRERLFPAYNTKKLSDAGMALCLIFLLTGYFTQHEFWYVFAIPGLVITMAVPSLLYPFARIWYPLTELLGILVSRLLLSLIFFLLVTPMGFLRRLAGKDNLRLKQFKKDHQSVFTLRNHLFTRDDLKNPF